MSSARSLIVILVSLSHTQPAAKKVFCRSLRTPGKNKPQIMAAKKQKAGRKKTAKKAAKKKSGKKKK